MTETAPPSVPSSSPTDPGENVLDSRDLADRQQELELDYDLDYEVYPGPAEFAAHIRETQPDDADEYEHLYAVNEEGRSMFGEGPWDEDGIILVLDDYFPDFAEQLAGDVGAIDSEAGWPLQFIDWEAAAASLQQDYSAIDYEGRTYWGRA